MAEMSGVGIVGEMRRAQGKGKVKRSRTVFANEAFGPVAENGDDAGVRDVGRTPASRYSSSTPSPFAMRLTNAK